MKNVINYFYGIIVNEHKKRANSFIFSIDMTEFEFIEYYGNLNVLINIYSILKNYGRQVYQIVVNKNNSFITYYENKPYILIKKINYNMEKFNLDHIVQYDCNIFIKEKLNWKTLWKEKIDYYEIQLDGTGLKYPLLKETFGYYLGLSEIAIGLLNYVDAENINSCIAHKRLEKASDLYNPLNIIIDNKIRDIAEFIKIKYFADELIFDEIINFLNKNFFTSDEMILFMSRLLYPSYYFDVYEKFYDGIDAQKELKNIIKKNTSYEVFLKKIYMHIKYIYNIPQIEFLEN